MVKKEIVFSLIIIFLIGAFVFIVIQNFQKDNSQISKKNYQNPKQNNQNLSKNNTTFFTKEEVEKHNLKNDCWLIINDVIYNVTNFINQHPGGSQVIIELCGQDATQTFSTRGKKNEPHPPSAYEKLSEFKIGQLKK